jgi:transcriptional regulator with XRE-family HTH domain
MSKRNKIVKETRESLALKESRKMSGLSIRKLAELMDYSHTRVHQMESGREKVTGIYIESYLEATALNREEWEQVLKGRVLIKSLRAQCRDLVDEIDESKINLIFGILTNLK